MAGTAVVIPTAPQCQDTWTAVGVWTELPAQVADVHIQAAVIKGELATQG